MIQLRIKYRIINYIANIHRWILCFAMLTLCSAAHAKDLSPYSTNELEELEKEFVQLINQSESVERHPLANEYINHIGKRLAVFANIKTPYFFIVKSREINAFAGPGGYIGINSQLILTTHSESELAGVMAHEIAHVRLHHLYSMMEHQKQMRIPMMASLLASAALGAINPTLGMGAMMGSISSLNQDKINFTRSKEKEADRIGIDMLIQAGFDPKGMASFFKKMQEAGRYYYTANIPAILRTHPMDEDRIAEAENRIQRATKKSETSSFEYSLFKELIRTSVVEDKNQLMDFYAHQCNKHHPEIACRYGRILTLLHTNQALKAYEALKPVIAEQPNNLYFQTAMAEAELSLSRYPDALTRLATLYKNSPEDYAILLVYGQGLIAANRAEQAVNILLKGSRIYPQDLTLCRELARAEAKAQKKSYAYFVQAKCLLLEGQKRAAVAQLKVARDLAKKDPYLLARISASIEEIEFLSGH